MKRTDYRRATYNVMEIICQSAVNILENRLVSKSFFSPVLALRGYASWVKPDKWTVEDILPRMESILDSVCPAEHGIIVTRDLT